MKKRRIDISGLTDRGAIEYLLREIDNLYTELEKMREAFDGETVIMADGQTLEERLRKIENK